jgi:hypothetical protein
VDKIIRDKTRGGLDGIAIQRSPSVLCRNIKLLIWFLNF